MSVLTAKINKEKEKEKNKDHTPVTVNEIQKTFQDIILVLVFDKLSLSV